MLTFRLARPADIPFFVALSDDSATAAHWDESHYRAAFARGNPSERVIVVLEEDARPQGFLVAKPIGPEWEIENVAISPAARRRGLGSRLLVEFLSLARNNGARQIWLEVRASNQAARKLYEKGGFRESGRRPGYYHNPDEDAILYHLSTAGAALDSA